MRSGRSSLYPSPLPEACPDTWRMSANSHRMLAHEQATSGQPVLAFATARTAHLSILGSFSNMFLT